MTDETKAAQQELATLQFTRDDIKLITGTDEIDDTAFMRGQLMAQAEVRKSILLMAKQGSTPAQKQFLDLVAAAADPTKETKEAKELLAWAKKIPHDYTKGITVTLEWLFHKGTDPKQLRK